jgi:hypothetical protein
MQQRFCTTKTHCSHVGAATLGTVVKDRRVPTSECRAVQVNLVLIGPQHRSGFAPKQQSLRSLAKRLSLEVKGVVNLARTKTPSSLVYEQPTMVVLDFRHFYEPAPKQLAPSRKDVLIDVAKTKIEVGTSAFDASKSRPTNTKTAYLLQDTICGVKLGYSVVYANAASRLPTCSRE